MYSLRRPREAELAALVTDQERRSVSYGEIGRTREVLPEGYRHHMWTREAGSGQAAFAAARSAVRQWAGQVSFEIIAFSRPASILPRLGGPVARSVQQRTTRGYLDGLVDFRASELDQ